MVILRKK